MARSLLNQHIPYHQANSLIARFEYLGKQYINRKRTACNEQDKQLRIVRSCQISISLHVKLGPSAAPPMGSSHPKAHFPSHATKGHCGQWRIKMHHLGAWWIPPATIQTVPGQSDHGDDAQAPNMIAFHPNLHFNRKAQNGQSPCGRREITLGVHTSSTHLRHKSMRPSHQIIGNN